MYRHRDMKLSVTSNEILKISYIPNVDNKLNSYNRNYMFIHTLKYFTNHTWIIVKAGIYLLLQ